jgi:nicotinate-nucleotide--dimethylbenzimidazole phosphoribosyltransferase
VTNLANLAELAADVEWPDHDATIRAHDSLLNGPALGELGRLAEWTCGVQGQYPPIEFARARLVVFAADHAIAAAGVSRADPDASVHAIAAIESGAASTSVLSRLIGVGIRVVQLDPATGRIDLEDAMTAAQCADAMVLGGAIADEEIDAGADLLLVGNIGIASTTVAGAIISVLTSAEPIKVTGRGGSRIDDDAWMRKVSAIRDARLRGWPARSEPQQLLAAIGGPDLAAITGLLLRAATRRTPVILDGIVAAAAAVVAAAEQPRAARWWLAAQRTAEPAQPLALARLDLTPVLDLGLASGDGSAGLLAFGLLRAAVALVGAASTANAGSTAAADPPAAAQPAAEAAADADADADGLSSTDV